MSPVLPARAAPLMDEPMGVDIAKARILVISDGRTGSENRSLGVVEMLGVADPEVITLVRKIKSRWLSWLPVPMVFDKLEALDAEASRVDVLVGSGYQVSRVLRWLKKRHPRLFVVALMRPAGKARDYDVVAVEQHDHYPKASNVVATLCAPNRITRATLEREADRWKKRLNAVPAPRLGVLLGGASRHGALTTENAQSLMKEISTAAKNRGLGLLVTASRRTGEPLCTMVRQALEKTGLPYFMWHPGDPTHRDNPYFAYLGLADALVVTADSVSMVSEAATAGKPVYLWGKPQDLPPKFREFYATLIKQGRAKWWDGTLNLRVPAAGVMDTLMVVGFIRARWNKRTA